MLKSSPMLGSVYSRVKEPLRITPSKYKTYKDKRKSGIGGIGIGEGRRENIRGNVPEDNSGTLGWRNLRVGGRLYTKGAQRTGHVWFPTKDKHRNQQRRRLVGGNRDQ
jgi:hypothetical protein